MRKFREDNDYSINDGPIKVSAKIRNGHTGSIKVELNDETVILVLSGDDVVEEYIGTKNEIISSDEEPELYIRTKVNRASDHPKAMVSITIHDGEENTLYELNESFTDEEGTVHNKVKYETYFDMS